jgi:hypothetical protein
MRKNALGRRVVTRLTIKSTELLQLAQLALDIGSEEVRQQVRGSRAQRYFNWQLLRDSCVQRVHAPAEDDEGC